ncbi:hypothetical protein D9M70_595280 [compost metagenome]
MGTVQAIRHDVLAAHGAFLLQILFVSHRHAGDGYLHRQYRVDGRCECQLDRSTHLASINLGGHHRPESTHIEEVLAHPRG